MAEEGYFMQPKRRRCEDGQDAAADGKGLNA